MIITSISFILSCCVLINIFYHKEWWNKTFYQLIFPLALFDLIGSTAWFGPSFHMPILQCRIREYIYQGAIIYKASITVAFCYVSLKIITTMEPYSKYYAVYIIMIVLLCASLILLTSIFLNTASIYCRDDFHESKFIAMGALEVGTVYFCILLDFFFYALIRRKLRGLRHHILSQPLIQQHHHQQSILTNEVKLVYLVRKLRFYPFLFFICFLPESFSLLYSILTGRSNVFLVYVSAIFLPSNGIATSIYYFIQQNMLPDVRSIYNITPNKLPTEFVRGKSHRMSSDHDTESNYDHQQHLSEDILRIEQNRSISSHIPSSRKYSRISSIESDSNIRPDASIDTFQTAFASPNQAPYFNLPTNTNTPTFHTSNNFYRNNSTNSYRSNLPHHSSEQFLTRNLSKSSYHTTHQDIQDDFTYNNIKNEKNVTNEQKENNDNHNDNHNNDDNDNDDQFEHLYDQNCQESLNSEFIHTESFSSSCRDSLNSYGKPTHPQDAKSLLPQNYSFSNNSSHTNQQSKKELLKKYNSQHNNCTIM